MVEININPIHPNHPIFFGYDKLDEDDEILRADDETACLSCLLTKNPHTYEHWKKVDPDIVGKTILKAIENDADCNDRVFRRKQTISEISDCVKQRLAIAFRPHTLLHSETYQLLLQKAEQLKQLGMEEDEIYSFICSIYFLNR